tara:strand:+ start:2107 stop:2430 length:324 start_codon:yes stop_codon:yes gene_type:complete
MGLTQNNDLQKLLLDFNNLKIEISSLQNKVNEDKILELDDENWENVRKKRDYLLKSSDWTMTPGATVDQSQWSAYRQNLRDLPQKFKDKESTNVIWPTIPSTKGPNT